MWGVGFRHQNSKQEIGIFLVLLHFSNFIGFFFRERVIFEKCTFIANSTLHIILDVCKYALENKK